MHNLKHPLPPQFNASTIPNVVASEKACLSNVPDIVRSKKKKRKFKRRNSDTQIQSNSTPPENLVEVSPPKINDQDIGNDAVIDANKSTTAGALPVPLAPATKRHIPKV